mgnify:CR=1 FL=1
MFNKTFNILLEIIIKYWRFNCFTFWECRCMYLLNSLLISVTLIFMQTAVRKYVRIQSRNSRLSIHYTCNFRHLNAFLCCNGLQCPSIFVYFCKAPKTSYFWETEVLGSSFDFYNSFRTHFQRHTKLPKQHKTPQCITRWIFELSFENAHLHFWVPLWHSILF